MTCSSVRLVSVFLLPLALATTLRGASNDAPPVMSLAVDSAPHMKLAVIGYSALGAQQIAAMETAFSPTEETHQKSMALISKNLTMPEALEAVEKSDLSTTSVKQFMGLIASGQQLRSQKLEAPGALDTARKMLNGMIEESATKYDKEIAKCTSFYAQQCSLMEVARSQISSANFVAATARALILDAQANIVRSEKDIPVTKKELKDHNRQCKEGVAKLNKRLKAVMGDIEVLTMILKSTDCDAKKKFLQMDGSDALDMLKCENQCTNATTLSFKDLSLQKELDQLKTPVAHQLIREAFADFFDDSDNEALTQVIDIDDDDSEAPKKDEPCRAEMYEHGDFKGWKADMKQGDYDHNDLKGIGAKNDDASSIKVFGKDCEAVVYEHGGYQGWKATFPTGVYPFDAFKAKGAKNDKVSSIKVRPIAKEKTKMNVPPMPKTVKVPSNPCTDPNQGAPPTSKRGGKCTLKKGPRCYKLQGRFMAIQAGIEDERDKILEDIAKMEGSCDELKKALEASIENDDKVLADSQTKLAAATEKEASASEESRQVSKENDVYNADLMKEMKLCTANYVNFETELCALKKIRGDIYKKFQKGHTGFFQDCELTPWTPEACTKKCAGGEQKLTRSVMKHPDGGAKCLPLAAKKRCNLTPCPIDCRLHQWSGWSKCSAKCGGGVTQRVRDVKTSMKYNGKPCAKTSETKACNVAACEKDCTLHSWTQWTGCSKHCDGGTAKRARLIKTPAEGDGVCAGTWDPKRLQYKACSLHRCKVPDAKKVMACSTKLDMVLLMDLGPKSGEKAMKAQQTAAKLLVDAFTGSPNFAIIEYTGPRTWSGVSKCTGKSTKKINTEKVCKVKITQHFEEDNKKTKGVIDGLKFAPGAKLLSLALMTVTSELPLGRKDARTNVVVFIDGPPLSFRKTYIAARSVRKAARLVFVPIVKFSPLKSIKTWVSRRWQENLVTVSTADQLAKPETGTHIVANICPRVVPKLKV